MSRFVFSLALASIFAVLAYSQSCSVAQNCTRTMLNLATSDRYVQCNAGQCVCGGSNNCFEMDSSTTVALDVCTLNSRCFTYSNLGVCESTARNWITAVLLQAFIGEVGAANFYIERTDLAVGQLILFLILVIFPFFLCCASCVITAACACGGEDSAVGKICGCSVILIIVFLVIIVLVASFAVPIWWIADLIIIALNERRDVNGCMLNRA